MNPKSGNSLAGCRIDLARYSLEREIQISLLLKVLNSLLKIKLLKNIIWEVISVQ